MKTILLMVFTLLSYLSYGQKYFIPEENNLRLGGLPKIPLLQNISSEKANEVLKLILSEEIEYRYINGSCEDRAHFITMILEKNKIKCGKIWAFAPSKYTLISKKNMVINDPYGINKTVQWGFHVAPILLIESDTLIMDLSFDNESFISKSNWLKKLDTNDAIYFYSNTNDYLFNTLGGDKNNRFTDWRNDPKVPNDNINITLPDWIPSVISGDFWSLNSNNDNVYKGMALNDLGYKIHELSNSNISEQDKIYLREIVTNIDSIQNEIANQFSNDNLSIDTFALLQNYYSDKLLHWKNRFEYYKN